MSIYLGNQTLEQIENRLSISISEEDKKVLETFYSQSASVPSGTWHCFDIPFMMMCGDIETAKRVVKIFTPYSKSMKGQFQIGYNK